MTDNIFKRAVEDGLKGLNQGLNIGLPRLNAYIHGVQKKYYYVIGGGPKSGKTAFLDNCFILQPYINDILPNKEPVEYHYFSMEIDLVEKIAKWVAYFMDIKYGIYCDSNYILGRSKNKLTPEHLQLINEIYDTDIVNLFGDLDENGIPKEDSPKLITFYQDKETPTGIYNTMFKVAEKNGRILRETVEEKDEFNNKTTKQRIVGYVPYNPKKRIICIVDHVALCRRNPGLSEKENIDRLSDGFVFLRNMFGMTIIVLSQFNRELENIDRLKVSRENLAPTRADFKGTGNLSEDANLVIGLLNPNVYPNLENHLGYSLRDWGNNYRSVHIVASRNVEGDSNISVLLEGKTGRIVELPKKDDHMGLEKMKKYKLEKGL